VRVLSKEQSRINNCYRAILAQVNYLDGIYTQSCRIKELYEELTVLALYIMEGDGERVIKGITPLFDIINDIANSSEIEKSHEEELNYIMAELRTHLQYLLITCNEESRTKGYMFK